MINQNRIWIKFSIGLNWTIGPIPIKKIEYVLLVMSVTIPALHELSDLFFDEEKCGLNFTIGKTFLTCFTPLTLI